MGPPARQAPIGAVAVRLASSASAELPLTTRLVLLCTGGTPRAAAWAVSGDRMEVGGIGTE